MRNFLCTSLILLFLAFNSPHTANAGATVVISPAYISGQPGDEHPITITVQDANGDPVSDVQVFFSVSDWTGGFLPTSTVTNSDGIAESLLMLPVRSATIFVRADTNPSAQASMDVKITSIPYRLVKVSGENQSGTTGMRLHSPFVVRVEDVRNYALPGKWVTFSVVSGGGYLSTTTAQTNSHGEAQTHLTLGDTAGSNIIEVSVREVSPVRFRATAVAIPEKLVIFSGSDQTGVPKQRLAAPFAVQVIDNKGHGVENVRVTFKVTEGSGYVSPYWIRTDKDGFAKTDFTPKNPGPVKVEAIVDRLSPVTFTVQVGAPPHKVIAISGKDQNGVPGNSLGKPFVVEVQDVNAEPVVGSRVTFTVTAGGGRVSPAIATTDANGQARTYLTLGKDYGVNTVKASVSGIFKRVTFNATSEAKVHTGITTPPLMYWRDTSVGTLYRLLGTKVEHIVPGVKNVTSLAVDVVADRLYWTEKTGDRSGKIQGADLEGRNVQLIKELRSVPYSIAIDTAQQKLYLTNSWGKLQRLNVDGTNFDPNFITGLDAPRDIALDVASSKIYWTEGGRRIGRANLSGDPNIRNVVTGSGRVLSIAIAEGKVYWIEQLGQNGSRIRRIGVKNKKIEELVTLRGVPRGMAVDPTDRKLYWTTAGGRIQRATINGQHIQNVATGLIRPGNLVIDTTEATLTEIGIEAPQMALRTEGPPDVTRLLINYPNPFNPETWIPYHLAESTKVKVNIYDAQGTLVRAMTLGPQTAGYYTSRSRAAYWDGRNALGERVASGTYFYQLQTDKLSSTRKMVILK